MVKAIFLDIDGVLNSSRSVLAKIGVVCASQPQCEAYLDLIDSITYEPAYGAKFALKCVDPVCVGLVNRLIKESGASVVLSSTHRMHFDDNVPYGSKEHRELLVLYLRAMGLLIEDIDVTPVLHQIRGEEVRAYLDAHTEITEYVILDDSQDFHADQPLVHCNATYGFDVDQYREAACKLSIPAPSQILI